MEPKEFPSTNAPPPSRPTPRPPFLGINPLTRLTLRFDPAEPLADHLLLLLSSANSDLRLERSAEGELIVMSPAGTDSGGRLFELTGQIHAWTRSEGHGLGRAFDSSAGFRLPNGSVRSPDAPWVSLDRWNALAPEEQTRFAPLCPDFVVELRSPSDPLAEVRSKMREYLDQGAQLGWLIDPHRIAVEVYRPGREVEVREGPANLSGEDVLPGFTLDTKGVLSL